MEQVKMNFGEAIELLKAKRRVFRLGWHLQGMYLELQVPDEGSKMTLPYIYLVIPGTVGDDMTLAQNAQLVPWLASQTDVLSDDWCLVPESIK
jgi:hypothetical protein